MSMITVRDLLNDQVFAGHTVLGGAAGLDQVVRGAALVHTNADLSRVPAGAVAVMDIGDQAGVSSQHLVEVFCRRLQGRGGRMLVIVGHLEAVSMSTIRLADRFALPVVAIKPATVPGSAPAVTARVLALAHTPDILYARALATAAPRLATADTIERILSVVSATLNGRAALVSVDGRVVAGSLDKAQPATVVRHPSVMAERHTDYALAACPVSGTDHQVWLACEVEHGGPAWQDAARATLMVAAPAVAAWTTRERLAAERDRAQLANLLAELLQVDQASSRIPEHVASRAARAGITLDGWHVGVHFTWLDAHPGETTAYAETTTALRVALAREGFDVPIFDRADGWSWWTTSYAEPSQNDIEQLLSRLRHGLAHYNTAGAEHGHHLPLVAGVGQPAIGPKAIAATLTQAQQAAMAAAKTEPSAVEWIDDIGPERLLANWFSEPTFLEYSRQVLAPVLSAPDSATLLETLEGFLACGSSPTDTARRMSLHRNTVTQRISVVERLLGGPLATMDRLTLHLACRSLIGVPRSGGA
ncbi:helix-turn-helix domain-containing protein [Nonomuraea wenchangensis]